MKIIHELTDDEFEQLLYMKKQINMADTDELIRLCVYSQYMRTKKNVDADKKL